MHAVKVIVITYESSGFLTPTEQKGRFNLREVVTCQTASKKYAWLNTTPAVSEGYSDNESGEVCLKYFVPFTNNK